MIIYLNNMDLTDEQWKLIEPLLPKPRVSGSRGRPPLDQRQILNGILWKLKYDLSWRQLPSKYGSSEACFAYYNRWKRNGLIKEIISTLLHDVETRGHFGIQKALTSGVISLKEEGPKYYIYILAPYTELWQVSTAMLYYQKLAAKAGESYYQLLSD
jgi:transposase